MLHVQSTLGMHSVACLLAERVKMHSRSDSPRMLSEAPKRPENQPEAASSRLPWLCRKGSPRSELARVRRRDPSSVAAQLEISFCTRFRQEAPAACLGQSDPEISADCARDLLCFFGCDCRLQSDHEGYTSAVKIQFMFFQSRFRPCCQRFVLRSSELRQLA